MGHSAGGVHGEHGGVSGKRGAVPQWYLAMEGGQIIGGLGVIENDFHDRKDLAPNVCAVYTEEDKRGQGVAGALLNTVCKDMRDRGIDTALSCDRPHVVL